MESHVQSDDPLSGLEQTIPQWRESSPKALIPFVIFIIFYLGFAFAAGDFSKVPMSVAFMLASASALLLNHREKFSRKVELFALGMGHRDIMLMCLIFVLAGAFTEMARATGGVDAVVALAQQLVPVRFMVAGLFMVSCFISLAIGTSCGTIVAMIPIAVSLIQALQLSSSVALGAVVGGAMFGDNLSLISDTTIAATRTQGIEMRDKMLCNLKIVWIPALLCALLYLLPIFSATASIAIAPAVSWEQVIKALPYGLLLMAALMGMHVVNLLWWGLVLNGFIGWKFGSFTVVGALETMGSGALAMANTILVSLFAGGLLVLVRYNGGMTFVVRATRRWIYDRRTCERGICWLVGLMNLFTANNTIAILTAGSIAKTLSQTYGVDPKRTASLLDVMSCVVQGVLPYGAQILIATSLAATIHASAWDIIQGSYYALFVLMSVWFSIRFQKREKSPAGR